MGCKQLRVKKAGSFAEVSAVTCGLGKQSAQGALSSISKWCIVPGSDYSCVITATSACSPRMHIARQLLCPLRSIRGER